MHILFPVLEKDDQISSYHEIFNKDRSCNGSMRSAIVVSLEEKNEHYGDANISYLKWKDRTLNHEEIKIPVIMKVNRTKSWLLGKGY